MRCFPLFCLMLASGSLIEAADAAVTIRPVQIISQADVPAGAPQEARSVQFNKGFTVGYLIEGEDIVGVDKKSLIIDHILLPGGKDITKKRNGKDNFEFGSFPQVSDDGKFGFFQIQSEEHVFGKAETLDIKGSIGVRIASDLKTTVSKPHPLGSNESEAVEEFTVTFGSGPKQEKVPKFIQESYDNKIPIVVTGPLAKITQVRLVVAGKEIESGEWTYVETGPRTYFFPKSEGATADEIRIKYWKNFKVVMVPFAHQ